MQRWTIAFILFSLLVAGAAAAERYWDGNATLLPGDAAFASGAFAASNSFPAGTDVVVEDPDTGKSTVVRVIERITGQSDILIMLSPPAAEALGIEPGESVRVRVTIKPQVSSTSLAEDTGERVDPELAAATPQAPVPEVAQAAESATAEPEVAGQQAPSPEDEALLAELANRSPQKMLSLPPREDELFAYKEPAEEQPPAEEPAGPEVPGQAVEVASVDGTVSPPAPAPGPGLAEAQPPAQEVPQAESPLQVTAQPGTEVAVATLPAPELPPEKAPEVATEPAAPETAGAVAQAQPVTPAAPSVSAAKPGVYYVQLAAYSDEALAREAATKLGKTWPAAILAPDAGTARIFRLVIGPLNRAESGTLLNRFRHDGYPDAFVRAP